MTTEPHDPRDDNCHGQSQGSERKGDLVGAGTNALSGDARQEKNGAHNSGSRDVARVEALEPTFELVLAPKRPEKTRRLAFVGASIAAGLSIGYLFGSGAGSKSALDAGARNEQASLVQALPWKSDVASDARDKQEVAQLVNELRSLRAQIEHIRHNADNLRAAERLHALETAREGAVEAGKTGASANAKLEKLEARLSQLERSTSDRTPTGSVPKDRHSAKPSEEKRAEAKAPASDQKGSGVKARVPGYVLRDVYRGTAIVERRDGLVEEISRGDELPGAGRVTAIERHGDGWVVVTTQGVIDQPPY